MEAPHTGTVWLEVGSESVAIRFDWAAISALRARLGPDGWEAAFHRAFVSMDMDAVAPILEVGSGRPAAWWMEMSPPVVPAAKAAQRALGLAFWGPTGPEESPPPPPTRPKSRRTRTGSRGLFGRMFGWAVRRTPSGA